MAKKNLPAKQEERLKSTMGHFPDDTDLDNFKKGMKPGEKEIFTNAYKAMEINYHNCIQFLPLLKAYSFNVFEYHKITTEIGDQYTVTGMKGDEQVNPKILIADRFLNNAFKISKQLGLDPRSAAQIEPAPPPEKPVVAGTQELNKTYKAW